MPQFVVDTAAFVTVNGVGLAVLCPEVAKLTTSFFGTLFLVIKTMVGQDGRLGVQASGFVVHGRR